MTTIADRFPAGRWGAVMLVVACALVAGFSQRELAQRDEVVVRIDPGMTYPELRDRVRAVIGDDCVFAWGNPRRGARRRPGAIVWDGGRIDGWFVCGDPDWHKDPRLTDVFLVLHRDGQLWSAHPSGPGRYPLEIPDRPLEPVPRALAIVLPTESDASPEILFAAVQHLPRVALWAVVVFD
jgi:hypothetical protein